MEALRPYWYPVAVASDLADKPVAATVLGVRVVVYRAGARVVAFRDLCIHRGTPLSLGWVDGEDLVCAYHGWAYDRTGACVRIPSLDAGRPIPSKARAEVFAAEERHGLVWVCLGTPSRPIPAYPETEIAGYRTVWTQLHWQANAARAIENVMDFAHFPWVHPGVLGHRERPVYPDATVEVGDHHLGYVVDDAATNAIRTYTVTLPLTLHMHVARRSPGVGQENVTALFFMARPIAEHETLFYFGLARNHSLDKPDQVFADLNLQVTEQDRRLVEVQRPEELPLDLSAELHLRGSDAPAVEYRRALKRLGVNW